MAKGEDGLLNLAHSFLESTASADQSTHVSVRAKLWSTTPLATSLASMSTQGFLRARATTVIRGYVELESTTRCIRN